MEVRSTELKEDKNAAQRFPFLSFTSIDSTLLKTPFILYKKTDE